MKTRLFIDEIDGTVFVIIDHEDGSFTSMQKEEYDRRQANQNNPIGGVE
jgi:hypothetical protein